MVLPDQENPDLTVAPEDPCLVAFHQAAALLGFRTEPAAHARTREYHYNAGVLYGPETPEGYWHELAHFMLAPFNRRYSPDYGLGPSPAGGLRSFKPRVSDANTFSEEALTCYLQYLWVEHVGSAAQAAYVAEVFLGLPRGKDPWATPEGQTARVWFARHGYLVAGKPVPKVRPAGIRSPRFEQPTLYEP